MLHKSEIDARLRAIEAEIPRLRQNMNTLYRAFEDRADRLCCEVEPECQQYVLDNFTPWWNVLESMPDGWIPLPGISTGVTSSWRVNRAPRSAARSAASTFLVSRDRG